MTGPLFKERGSVDGLATQKRRTVKSGTIFGREPAMVLALVQAVLALVVAFGLNLAPDQIGAILAVTAVILGLITRSRVSPSTSP